MGCVSFSDTSGVPAGEGDAAGELSFNEEGAFIDEPKESAGALGEDVDAGVGMAVASVGTGLGFSGASSA